MTCPAHSLKAPQHVVRRTDTNNRLHGLLEHAPAFVCTLRGPEHVFAFLNPRYHQLVGASRARNVVGRPVTQALPEVVEQGFIDLLDRVYRTGESFHGNEVPIQLDWGASSLLEKGNDKDVLQRVLPAALNASVLERSEVRP